LRIDDIQQSGAAVSHVHQTATDIGGGYTLAMAAGVARSFAEPVDDFDLWECGSISANFPVLPPGSITLRSAVAKPRSSKPIPWPAHRKKLRRQGRQRGGHEHKRSAFHYSHVNLRLLHEHQLELSRVEAMTLTAAVAAINSGLLTFQRKSTDNHLVLVFVLENSACT
jgi:hypothetical protein